MKEIRMHMKRRRPLLAAFLSFCVPGLGQAYNTEWCRGGIVFLIFFSLAAGLTLLLIFISPSVPLWGIILIILMAMATTSLFSMVDAFRRARRLASVELTYCNRWWTYILLIAA